MTALFRSLTMVNRRGLHARASAKFVTAVAEQAGGCSVRLAKDGNSASGGSILGLMMLGAAKGDTVELTVEGPDSERVMALLAALIEDGFGED